jgi:endonuclease/exonuclease/phosphatase family metal-dependent hydrolase
LTTALLVLGLVLALGSAALTLARPIQGLGTPAVQLAAFTPLGLLGWPVAAVLFLGGRLWWAALAALAVTALHAAWLAGPVRANARPPEVADGAPALRVLTLNCLLGRANAAQIVNLVSTERIDVLLLEELTAGLVARLRAVGIDAVLSHHDVHPRPAGMGTGIWSRHPLHPVGLVVPDAPAMPQVTLEVPGAGPVTVTAVHTHPPLWRVVGRWRQQMATLTGVVADVARRRTPVPHTAAGNQSAGNQSAGNQSTGSQAAGNQAAGDQGSPGEARPAQILAGDFNATRDHREFRHLLAAGGLVDTAEAGTPSGRPFGALRPRFTWPADRAWPALTRLDHILVSSESIAVESHAVVAVEGSDHRGLIATLRLI